MSKKPTLYYALFSPPARACMIVAKLIGLDLELKSVNFAKREHLSDEFLKLNPQHQIPVFIDTDDEVYVDSHAIICFMVAKYGKNDQLYPQDLKRRAHIDHCMHFENGTLFQIVIDIAARNIYGGESEINSQTLRLCHNAYDVLEQLLQKRTFVAGSELSVADVSVNTTLITLDLLIPVERQRYPKVTAWLERMKPLIPDYEEINLKGAQVLQQRVLSCMADYKSKTTNN